MKEVKKQRGADPMEQCDSGLIFAGVTALMSTRAINLNDVLKYELASVPTSIFDIKDVVLNFVKYATNKMHCYRRTHVIFDRYNTSIKDATRCQGACEAAREYKLTMNAPLPQQQVFLSVTKTKVQLIDLICEELQ